MGGVALKVGENELPEVRGDEELRQGELNNEVDEADLDNEVDQTIATMKTVAHVYYIPKMKCGILWSSNGVIIE